MSNRISLWQRCINNRWTLFVFRIIVGGTFILAGSGKIIAPYFFADSMAGFKLVPERILLPLELFFIWQELIWGMLVLIGICVREASAVIAGMLLIFLIALATAFARGLNIDCGCFGALLPSGVGWGSLMRTFVLLLFTVYLFTYSKQPHSVMSNKVN